MIQITVQPGTAGEMSVLARALCDILVQRESHGVTAPTVEPVKPVEKLEAEPVPAAEEKARKPRAKKVEAVVTEEAPLPAAEEAPAEPAPAPAEEAPKAVSLEVVRSLAASLSQQGKAAQVKQAIADMGAARLTDLDPSAFAALHEVLLGL